MPADGTPHTTSPTSPYKPGEQSAAINPYVAAKAQRAAEREALADLSRRSDEALKAAGGDKLAALKLMLGVAS